MDLMLSAFTGFSPPYIRLLSAGDIPFDANKERTFGAS
jgi:hypothetical protein